MRSEVVTTHAPRRIAASPRQQPPDAMRPRSTAEPHAVRRRRWALHTNWTARPLFCAATNALLSANGRKVSAFTGSDLPERRFWSQPARYGSRIIFLEDYDRR